jgi:hypothetical protein
MRKEEFSKNNNAAINEPVEVKSKINFRKYINYGLFNRFLGVVIIGLAIYYCAGLNDLSVKGFRLQELKRELAAKEEENSNLNNKVLALQSLANINDRLKNVNMVAVGSSVDYLTTDSGSMARR